MMSRHGCPDMSSRQPPAVDNPSCPGSLSRSEQMGRKPFGRIGSGLFRQFRAVLPVAVLALASCALPYDEPFISPYDKVSGAGGTIWFVSAQKLRNCTWFECGESSTKTLGATLTAYALQKGKMGRLTFTRVARLVCDADNVAACDIVATAPQLRLQGGRLVLENSRHSPVATTIAWSGMRDFELGRSIWLCTAESLPRDAAAKVLKVAPKNAGLTGVGQVVYALPHAPGLADARAHCVSLAALPRAQGAPDKLFLGDAVRDGQGRWHLAYLAKMDPYDWQHVVPHFATFDGKWRSTTIRLSDFGNPSPVSIMPGFLDTRGGEAILYANTVGTRSQVSITLYAPAADSRSIQTAAMAID